MMIFFKIKQKKLLDFIKQKATEKGMILCPNCGKEDINLLFNSECAACKSPILTIDEKLSFLFAVEIVKEYMDKYEERTPRQIIDPIVQSCDQVLRTLLNDKMPSDSEISPLQRAFSNITLGGLTFGGGIRLNDGKHTLLLRKLKPTDALKMRTSEFEKELATQECLISVSLAIKRIQQQNTSDPELSDDTDRNLSDSGNDLLKLELQMWSRNPYEKAEAIKSLFLVLFSNDMAIVQKASSALSQLSIGTRYLEMALQNPELSSLSQSIIAFRAHAIRKEGFFSTDLNLGNLEKQVQSILTESIEEANYHNFSSLFHGIILDSNPRIQYAYDINYIRQPDLHGLISFSPINSEEKCRDEDCLSVTNCFAKRNSFCENFELSNNSNIPGIRYFGWSIPFFSNRTISE